MESVIPTASNRIRGQGAGSGGVKADPGEFEEEFVIGGVRFVALFLEIGFERGGWFAGQGLAGQGGVGGSAHDADCAGHVKFVTVVQNFGFQGLWGLGPAEAVSADAMENGCQALRRPAFCDEHCASKLSRGQMMGRTIALAIRCGVGGVMQQHGGEEDFQVCAFDLTDALRQTIDAQDVIEIVNGIGVGVPRPGLFD